MIHHIFHHKNIVFAAHCIVSPSVAPSQFIMHPSVHDGSQFIMHSSVHDDVGVVKNDTRPNGQSCRKTFVAAQLLYCWMCRLSRSTLVYIASLSVCDSWSTRCFFVGGGADANIPAGHMRCSTSTGAEVRCVLLGCEPSNTGNGPSPSPSGTLGGSL